MRDLEELRTSEMTPEQQQADDHHPNEESLFERFFSFASQRDSLDLMLKPIGKLATGHDYPLTSVVSRLRFSAFLSIVHPAGSTERGNFLLLFL